jgi:protease IV
MTALVLAAHIATAYGQSTTTRYAEEPTGGVALPTTPLAGDQDARAVVINPGGLPLLAGPELAAAVDVEDSSVATSAGPGFGLYGATTGGGTLLPHFGVGVGFEWLRPPSETVAPDPGTPFRFTLAAALALGENIGVGASWHHFIGEGALSGVNAFDLGVSTRWGSRLAVGATLLDVDTQAIAGTPVQRRYQLEAMVRPLATSALELAVGGQLGETRLDLTGWARAAVRVARGTTLIAQIESRDLHELVDSPGGVEDLGGRELRATVGVDLSFGRVGLTALGTGANDTAMSGNHLLGGTFVARVSAVGPRSLLGRDDHIERVELRGELGVRELTAVVLRLRAIARDASVKAVVVQLDGIEGGWGALEEIRDELRAVRRAGKRVFAYMVAGNGRDYFVASVADRIYLDPAGGLRVTGMATTTLYFRSLLDHFAIVPEVERIGDYKSAPEQLTATGPTPAASEQRNALIDSLWARWVEAIASSRTLTAERVRQIVDHGSYTAGQLAADHTLVDAVGSPEKISELIAKELGAPYPVEDMPRERATRWASPGVAIIYVDGDITDGKSRSVPVLGGTLSGGETIVEALQAARSDPRVDAIILRVDSPGGSSVASELMSREVFATRGVKPILCSFSNVAASGGYFVAAGCDMIFAEPMTITGSIGIFAGKLDLSGLLAKLGIAVDTVKRGAQADADSWYHGYTDEERAAERDQLAYAYSRFVGAVAAGRRLPKPAVDELGRGRVYTGQQAFEVKLIDRFGGIADAIDEAKRRIGLGRDAEVRLFELPRTSSSILGAISNLLGARAQELVLPDLPLIRALLRSLPPSLLVDPDRPQARLPFAIDWQ